MQIGFSILFLLVGTVASVGAVCYNDTEDMLLAQVAGETQLEICAGTTLELGFPLSADLTVWSGMTPLVIINDDVEVYCGADKQSSNNCVFDGGVLQIVTSVFNPLLALIPTNSTSNLKITGITFQGNLTDVPGLFGATPLAIGAPGTNIVIEDCIFQDLNTTHVVNLARNQFTSEQDFAPKTAAVTIVNSVFRNILFSADVVYNSAQTLNLNNLSMTNLQYNSACGCLSPAVIELDSASTTNVNNVTMKDVETYYTVVRQVGEETEFNYEALTVENLVFTDQANRDESDYCAGILITDSAVVENATVECVVLVSDEEEDTPSPDGTPPPEGSSPSDSSSSTSLLVVTTSWIMMAGGLIFLSN